MGQREIFRAGRLTARIEGPTSPPPAVREIACKREVGRLTFSVCADVALSRAIRVGKPVWAGDRLLDAFRSLTITSEWKGYVGGAPVFFVHGCFSRVLCAPAKSDFGTGFRSLTGHGYELCFDWLSSVSWVWLRCILRLMRYSYACEV